MEKVTVRAYRDGKRTKIYKGNENKIRRQHNMDVIIMYIRDEDIINKIQGVVTILEIKIVSK